MVGNFFSALVLGLIGGLIPGPVLAATFTEILQSSFLKGLRIILWAMLVETIIALASHILLSSLHLSEAIFRIISLVGAVILIKIAFDIWKVKAIDTNQRVHFKLQTIAAMIFANGVLWLFWVTVCVPKAIFLGQQIFLGQYLFLFLVEIGWLISTVAVAIVFSYLRKLLSNPKTIPLMFKFFSLVFVYFALNMVYQSVKYFWIK